MEHAVQPFPHQTPLTHLKGIGPAKASRIQQALQVEFAEDLVGLDADDIFHQLAATGTQIPRREIQHWLVQALRLVNTQEAAAATEPQLAPATPGGDAGSAPPTHEHPGGQFAIARVGDQLQVKYQAPGQPPAELTTADPQALYQWVQAQLTPEQPAANAVVPPPPWRIEITRVEVVPLAPPDGPMPSPYLARGAAFVVGVNFQLTGIAAAPAPVPMTAVAQFSMRNRLTGETIALGTAQGQCQSQDTAYLQSPPATLTSPGVYQLQAVLTLQGQEAVTGYRQLQLVKVL
jgi:hypothetical protein